MLTHFAVYGKFRIATKCRTPRTSKSKLRRLLRAYNSTIWKPSDCGLTPFINNKPDGEPSKLRREKSALIDS
jgi:hypothetical protein